MQIAIDLPNDFVVLQSIKEIEQDMRLSYSLWLFKNAKITLSKAAELAALDIYAFIAECKKNEVPVIDITKAELQQQIKHASALTAKQSLQVNQSLNASDDDGF